MNGFIFDENLPVNVQFTPSLPVTHVTNLGNSLSDEAIWEYAKAHNLVIVTKDTDFSDRIIISNPPPRVVHLRFGNMRKRDFHSFLSDVWPQIENLLVNHKLVNVYLAKIEAIE
ncbi:MAG: DUF5615 family PIN-like protein [Cyanobacteria bacterium J06634_6]